MARNKSGKCGCKARVVSEMAQTAGNCCQNGNAVCCTDVCAHPIFGTPDILSIMAPLIYDEIGINLCATATLGVDISTTYPTAVSASARVLGITYVYGDGNVTIDRMTTRSNCYVVTLTNLTVALEVSIYDEQCRLLAMLYPTIDYLPSDITAPTYDEDTNPTSVELEIFAPYGVSYEGAAEPSEATMVLNNIGMLTTNNFVRQGLNLYGIAKVLNLDTDDDTITIGLSLILQSLYFAGYRVASEGRINTPKGSLLLPDNSSCRRFVAGDLLDLEIKPLELGPPFCEELFKENCAQINGCNNGLPLDSTIVSE